MKKNDLIYLISFIFVGVLAGVVIYYSFSVFEGESVDDLFLKEEVNNNSKTSSNNVNERAVLTLAANDSEYKVGDDVIVDVYLDTNGEAVDGVDLILEYNPSFVQLNGTAKFFNTEGSVFSNFIGAKADKEEGRIEISALTSPGNSFQGRGKIGSLVFSSQSAGNTKISFVFKKGDTTDTNVSSYSQSGDTLDRVQNVSLTIL